jgi:hypothetical protein
MNKQQWTLLGGVGLGAGLMFLLDPDKGRRRRALLRDKTKHSLHLAEGTLRKTSRDLGNRTRGLAARVRSRLHREQVQNDVLEARVRAHLGRAVSHPGAIEVRAEDGRMILSGPVLADEIDDLLSAARRVRGVRAVENRLEVHAEPGDVPALQGGPARPPARRRLLRLGRSRRRDLAAQA